MTTLESTQTRFHGAAATPALPWVAERPAENSSVDCRIAGAADSLDTYWEGQVDGYRTTNVVLFAGQVSTGCGGATSASRPFYCPPD